MPRLLTALDPKFGSRHVGGNDLFPFAAFGFWVLQAPASMVQGAYTFILTVSKVL
jgi:hypothetical protein